MIRDARPYDESHVRPAGASDALVDAVGQMSEAFEWVERARERLYDFHQMMGHADELFDHAADALKAAGETDTARFVRTEIVGRNVINGRWTFQLVEEFDDCYYGPIRDVDRLVRDRFVDGKRHVREAEMKEQRRTHGHPAHASDPRSER